MHECVGVWLFVQGERTRERERERASVSTCGTFLSHVSQSHLVAQVVAEFLSALGFRV
jgi:hypothetical protein